MNEEKLQKAIKNVPRIHDHFKGIYYGKVLNKYLNKLNKNLDFIIMNTTSYGEHWYIIYKYYTKFIIFDSLIKNNSSLPLNRKNVKKLFLKNIQEQTHLTCGEHCLSFIYYLHTKEKKVTHARYISYLKQFGENNDQSVWNLIYTIRIYGVIAKPSLKQTAIWLKNNY